MYPHRLISGILAFALTLPGQQASPPASNLVAQGSGLKIVVIDGEGATNVIKSRSGHAPVVEVRDESDKPVPGAEVVFQLPLSGASGFFNGWLKSQTVRTDRNGRAGATGYTPNEEEGRLNIKVTATMGANSASAVIAQTNVRTGAASGPSTTSPKSNRSGWWKVAAVVGGGALVGGIVAATRNGSETTAATAPRVVTISVGAITVGGPR